MSTRTRSQLRWPEPGGEIRSLGVVPNCPESIGKLVKNLGPVEALRVCYEAGPTGYVIYWQLAALRGIARVSAVTTVAEVGDLSRFQRAPQLMGYSGMGAREDSSGPRTRQRGITKTGNAHLRRIAIEAA